MRNMLKKVTAVLLSFTFIFTGVNVFANESSGEALRFDFVLEDITLNSTTFKLEVKQGYWIGSADMILLDRTENKKSVLSISGDNPDVTGIGTNKITCSNLRLIVGHEYQIDVPERTILSYDGLSWNQGFSTGFGAITAGTEPILPADPNGKAVDGLVQSVELTTTQLTIQAQKGYIFDGSDIILTDLTINKQYVLGIWTGNSNVRGVSTDKIVYSNLQLTNGHSYEIRIKAHAIVKSEYDPNNYTWNKEYVTVTKLNNSDTLYGDITILSPSKSDYYLGGYVNQSAIGNSVSVTSISAPNRMIFNLAEFVFILQEFSEDMFLKQMSDSEIAVSDFEVKINGRLVQTRANDIFDLMPNQYYATAARGELANGKQFTSLVVNVCGVASGDKVSIKIPAGKVYVSGTMIQNTSVEFTFNVLTSQEKTEKYSQYYVNGVRYPNIPPATIIDPKTPPTVSRFPDLPTTHWAYSSIMTLVDRGVLSGYSDGTFRPDGLVSRSEFATMMTRVLEIPLVTNATPTFVDVGRNDWDFVYVETAKKYLTGYQQGNSYYFKGKEQAVREDMAVALVKALKLENQQVNVNELKNIFKDYDTISPNLQKYVLIAYRNNLIGGYPDGTFGAQRSITRAEAASLLIRVLNSEAMQKVAFN